MCVCVWGGGGGGGGGGKKESSKNDELFFFKISRTNSKTSKQSVLNL